jgi:endonuclease YncB( thermonuclease family)
MVRILFPGMLAVAVVLACAAKGTTYGDISNVEVVSVYDGDTLSVNVPDWPPVVGERVPVRVRGIDAPEIRGRCPQEKAQARVARDVLRRLVGDADRVTLRGVERGKYFRLVATVFADGKNVADELIARGLARRYDGSGPRAGWCS